MLSRIAALILLSGGAALGGVAASVYLYKDPDPVPLAAAIVVLSGPGAGSEVTGETMERVERGIALLQANAAPLLVMSGGGRLDANGLGDADIMAAYARDRGVPDALMRLEARSNSTLQNAWLTAKIDDIDPAEPVILVTHRYHLPRAWASFRWAGFTDIALIAADRDAPLVTAGLLMETVKWPANAVRAAGASAAFALGADEDRVVPWLR